MTQILFQWIFWLWKVHFRPWSWCCWSAVLWSWNRFDFLFFRHLTLLFAVTFPFPFQSPVTSSPPMLPCFYVLFPSVLSFLTLWCRLSLSSFISARKPALARTTAPTSSSGPPRLTALPNPTCYATVSRSMTPSPLRAFPAPTPPRLSSPPRNRAETSARSTDSWRDFSSPFRPTIAMTRLIGVFVKCQTAWRRLVGNFFLQG